MKKTLEQEVIDLILGTKELRENFMIEAKSSSTISEKTKWAKDFIDGGLDEECTWLSFQLSMILIEQCNWTYVFERLVIA